MHGDDFVRLFGDLLIRLLPAYLLVVVAHSFAGMLYSVAVVDKILCRSALAAAVALCAGTVRVGANADDLVVFNLHFQAAAQSTEVALCLFPNSHVISLRDLAQCAFILQHFISFDVKSLFRQFFSSNVCIVIASTVLCDAADVYGFARAILHAA